MGVVVVMADASATLGIISRRAAGKARHLDTSHRWIHEAAARRAVPPEKTSGASIVADPMTKELPLADVDKYVELIGEAFRQGRSEYAA